MALRDPRSHSLSHMQPREPDPSFSRSYGDPSSQAIEVFKKLAKEQLIPQISEREHNAIQVDGRQVFFYQRLRSGRRCSCFTAARSTPHAECPICFNTGFAGGFLKWGTDLYMFDPSRQFIGVNTTVNPLIGVPPWFSLETGYTSGYIEWDEPMSRSLYYGVDSWQFEYRKEHGDVTLNFKLVGTDQAFVPFTEDALKQRIPIAACGTFKFRVTLKRTVATDPSPLFQFFYFRTLVNGPESPILVTDWPRRQETNAMEEWGALELFNQVNVVFSNEINAVNLQDVIIRLYDMTRWKVIESSPNDPQNIVTSHDVGVAKIQEDEPEKKIPL